MARNVTLFTGQWADLKLEDLAPMAADFGYDGLELACWGDHLDVDQGAESKSYCEDKLALLEKHGLKCWAISNHLAGQLVCDPNNDSRSDGFVPEELAGKAEEKIPGVIGPLPGMVASIQVMEVLKYILGMDGLLKNRLLLIQGSDMTIKTVNMKRNPNCKICSTAGVHG